MADTKPITAALAEIDGKDLLVISSATFVTAQTAPQFLGWLDNLCEWEISRRKAVELIPAPPSIDLIPPEERAASIATAKILRTLFIDNGRAHASAVPALFDVIVTEISALGRRPSRSTP